MRSLYRLLLALVVLAAATPSTFALETTFSGAACPDGVYLVGDKESLPDSLIQPGSLWGTRCARGDADTGTARSTPFELRARSVAYLSGYPLQPGLGVFLINLSTQESVQLTPPQNPREAWARFDLPMRDKWRGALVALELRDQVTGSGGWVGVSAGGEIPMQTRQENLMFEIAGAYGLASIVFGLPLIAAFLAFRTFGVQQATAGAYAVATSGLLAYLAFWLAVALPAAVWAAAIALPLISVALILVAALRGNALSAIRGTSSTGLIIGFVWAVGLVFLACGHLYGPTYWPGVNTNVFEGYFFEQSRPYDDIIPLNFAQEILSPTRDLSAPDIGGWHYSDRGPLQTGYALLATPIASLLGWNAAYQAVGTFLQIVSFASIWVFARAIGVKPRPAFLILVASVFSPLVYFNALYVWPKMLAGGFCLLSLAILFPPLIRREKLGAGPGVCAAILAGLSILAHGATIFAFAAAGFLMLPAIARVYPLRTLAPMLAASVALVGSWTAYATFIDPGEDRLTRLHFTGGVDEPGLSIGTRVVQSHLKRDKIEWAKDRLSNFATLFGDGQIDRYILATLPALAGQPPSTAPPVANPSVDISRLAKAEDFERLIAILRVDQREFVFRSLAFAGAGFILIFIAWTSRSAETADLRRALRISFWFILITTLMWSVAEFYGARTVVTHASFGYLYVIAVAALASASLVFAPLVVIACLANIGVLLAVWIIPGPGIHLRNVLTQANLEPALQQAALVVLAPSAVLAIALAVLNLIARGPEPAPAAETES